MAYEKMNCLYETVDDLQARIGNTLCRYKGQPVWVTVVNHKTLKLYNVDQSKEVGDIRPSDSDFDISSAEVGYVNYRGKDSRNGLPYNRVYYLERLPYRRYRQGLNAESLYSYDMEGKSGIPPQTVLTNPGMGDSLMGVYPSIKEAQKCLSGTSIKEMAIAQDIALKKTDAGIILVFYRQDNIGWITPDSSSISIERSADSWVYSRIMRRFMGRG